MLRVQRWAEALRCLSKEMVTGKQAGFPVVHLGEGDYISACDFNPPENTVAGLQDTKGKTLLQVLSLKKTEES